MTFGFGPLQNNPQFRNFPAPLPDKFMHRLTGNVPSPRQVGIPEFRMLDFFIQKRQSSHVQPGHEYNDFQQILTAVNLLFHRFRRVGKFRRLRSGGRQIIHRLRLHRLFPQKRRQIRRIPAISPVRTPAALLQAPEQPSVTLHKQLLSLPFLKKHPSMAASLIFIFSVIT